METREAGSHPRASSAKSKVTGLLHALRRLIFKQWFSSSKEGPVRLATATDHQVRNLNAPMPA